MSALSPSQIRYVWFHVAPNGTINGHKNGGTVTKNGTGDFSVTFAQDLPSQYYHIDITPEDTTSNTFNVKVTSQTKSGFDFEITGGGVEILGVRVVRESNIDPDTAITIFACA